MKAAVRIAAKDLKLRIRDRSFLITGVVAPLGLAFMFDLILGGVAGGEFRPTYAVVDTDGGTVAGGLVEAFAALAAAGTIELVVVPSPEDARSLVEEGSVDAAILIPRGLSEAVLQTEPARVEIVGNVDSPTGTLIARSVVESFTAEVRSVQVAVASAVAAGVTGDPATLADEAARTVSPIRVGSVGADTRELDLTTFFAASMGTFFLFFTVQSGVVGLLEERETGTLARLLAAPIPAWSIVAGKILVSFALGILSMIVLIVASTVLMGAEWGDPLGVGMLVVAGVSAAVGIMLVVAAFARTAEAAGNLQSIFAVGLGMLGGVFLPSALTGWIAGLSSVSPHRWFLLGLADLAGGGGGGEALGSVGALLAFAVGTSAIASFRIRRMVSPV